MEEAFAVALADYQQRVVEEKAELDKKRKALEDFFKKDLFGMLPADERIRMRRQKWIMDDYSEILWERIRCFGQ